MIDHWNFQELLYMDSIFKICITFKFSDFVVRSLLSAGGPYENKVDMFGCPWYKHNPEPYIRVIIIALEVIFVAASTDVAVFVVCLLNKQ